MAPQEEIARLKALLDTARSFGRAMDLGTLINEILDRSEEVMRAEGCSLLLPEPQTEDLVIHSTDARVAALPQPLKVPAGKGIAGAVFQSRKSLNIHDAQNDPRHYQGIGKQVGFVTRAILTIPLLDRSTCLGVLQALNPIGRDHFDAQDEEIFEGFGGLIAGALLRLEAQKREIERIQNEQEMLLAREIQDSFLPAGVQEFSACQVHHQYFPAKVVGGDFYFVHPIVGRRILLGLGDVTGKGVPAALTMARASAMIQAMAGQLGDDLGEWVTALNQQLVRDLRAGRFIGLTFLLADADAATLQICAAGQYAPLRCTGESWEQVHAPSHLPLGITSAATYGASRVPLSPGEFYLLFSDGIGEARNPAGEEFTTEGFLQKLPAGLTGSKCIPAATDAWRAFVGTAPQHDDVSLMLLDWRGLPPPPEIDLTCCPENLGAGRDFVERWAVHAGYEDIVRGQIVLACDEAVTNVYRHAYGGCPGPLKLRVELQSGFLRVQLRDQGKPVDPGCIQGRNLSDLRPGGLGTVILSQVFDEVTFEPQDVGTILTLRKRLP